MGLLRCIDLNELNSWQDCIDDYCAIKISVDIQKINSLLSTANGRIDFVNSIDITDNNVNFIFENYYTSILELLHSIVLKKGFKVSNHICLGFYLKDSLNNRKVFDLYDELRMKRNSLVYYGKQMDTKIVRNSVDKSKRLYEELLKLI